MAGNDLHLAEMSNVIRKDSTSSYMMLTCRQNGSNRTESYNILTMPPKSNSILRVDNLITMPETKYNTSLAPILFYPPPFSNSWKLSLLNFLTYSDKQSISNESPVK